MNFSFEIGDALLRAGLLHLTSAELPGDFCKGYYLDFLFSLVDTVEIKKIVVAEVRIENTVFILSFL